MIDFETLLYFAPYLVCIFSLLGGLWIGTFISALAQKKKSYPGLRERLTMYTTLVLWAVLMVVLWVMDQRNPLIHKINSGGGLT
jgi:hypothetical protein